VTVFSWWNVVPSTIGGLIGGTFAVMGMVVSGRRERIKDRERRTEEAIRNIQQCLLAVEDLYSTYTNADDPGGLTALGYDRRERLVSQLRIHVASIPVPKMRNPLEMVTRLISYSEIGTLEGYSDAYATHHICHYGLDLTAHYLVGDAAPAIPDFIHSYLNELSARERL
jgi:hypothetical protein